MSCEVGVGLEVRRKGWQRSLRVSRHIAAHGWRRALKCLQSVYECLPTAFDSAVDFASMYVLLLFPTPEAYAKFLQPGVMVKAGVGLLHKRLTVLGEVETG